MSRTAELAHDLAAHAEPDAPYTAVAWHALVTEAATAAWRTTNLTISYDTAYRVADAALRSAMPERIPEGLR